MNEHTTPSILQRVPVILAVTAASYGLPAGGQGHSSTARAGQVVSSASTRSGSSPDEPVRDSAAVQH
jgi:hypothetical protein